MLELQVSPIPTYDALFGIFFEKNIRFYLSIRVVEPHNHKVAYLANFFKN